MKKILIAIIIATLLTSCIAPLHYHHEVMGRQNPYSRIVIRSTRFGH